MDVLVYVMECAIQDVVDVLHPVEAHVKDHVVEDLVLAVVAVEDNVVLHVDLSVLAVADLDALVVVLLNVLIHVLVDALLVFHLVEATALVVVEIVLVRV